MWVTLLLASDISKDSQALSVIIFQASLEGLLILKSFYLSGRAPTSIHEALSSIPSYQGSKTEPELGRGPLFCPCTMYKQFLGLKKEKQTGEISANLCRQYVKFFISSYQVLNMY